jgi:hypothetical protein
MVDIAHSKTLAPLHREIAQFYLNLYRRGKKEGILVALDGDGGGGLVELCRARRVEIRKRMQCHIWLPAAHRPATHTQTQVGLAR